MRSSHAVRACDLKARVSCRVVHGPGVEDRAPRRHGDTDGAARRQRRVFQERGRALLLVVDRREGSRDRRDDCTAASRSVSVTVAPTSSVRNPRLNRNRVWSAGRRRTPDAPGRNASSALIGSSVNPIVPASPASLNTRTVAAGTDPEVTSMSALPNPVCPIAGSRSGLDCVCPGESV